jgi:hypothetical protein
MEESKPEVKTEQEEHDMVLRGRMCVRCPLTSSEENKLPENELMNINMTLFEMTQKLNVLYGSLISVVEGSIDKDRVMWVINGCETLTGELVEEARSLYEKTEY